MVLFFKCHILQYIKETILSYIETVILVDVVWTLIYHRRVRVIFGLYPMSPCYDVTPGQSRVHGQDLRQAYNQDGG